MTSHSRVTLKGSGEFLVYAENLSLLASSKHSLDSYIHHQIDELLQWCGCDDSNRNRCYPVIHEKSDAMQHACMQILKPLMSLERLS